MCDTVVCVSVIAFFGAACRKTGEQGRIFQNYSPVVASSRQYGTTQPKMEAECTVCCERLDLAGGGPDQGATAQCGHVFHKSCYLRWVAEKSNCPKCRKSVTKKHLIPLYFDLASTSSQDLEPKSPGVSVAALSAELLAAKEDLIVREAQLKSLEEEKASVTNTLEKQLAHEKRACKRSVEELKKTIRHLREELKLKSHVDKLMSDNDHEWKAELANYPDGDERTRALVLMYTSTRRELRKAQVDGKAILREYDHEKSRRADEVAKIRRENEKLQNELQATKAELADIREKYEKVEAVAVFNSRPGNVPVPWPRKKIAHDAARLCATQPATSKENQLDTTIVLSSDDEDRVSDGGYIRPSHLTVTMKRRGGDPRFNGNGGSGPRETAPSDNTSRAGATYTPSAAKKPRIPKQGPASSSGTPPVTAYLHPK